MSAKTFLRSVLPLLVLVAAVFITIVLVSTAPKPEQTPQQQQALKVDAHVTRYGPQQFDISAFGVVKPAREVVIQAQVGGIVTEIADNLVPGGYFVAGEKLFQIDATDYELAVESAGSRLAEAKANLALEQGRQEIARREWSLFADDAGGLDDSALALREPQLQMAEAAVASARAQLRQAEVYLARTEVSTPFNAVVRSESTDLGQTLSVQSAAAVLVGTDTFRVQVSLPSDKLPFIRNIDTDKEGVDATVIYDSGQQETRRSGNVVRVLSDLDPRGQMARVLIEVDDPLSLNTQAGTPPLLLDSYVAVHIASDRRAHAVEVPREWLRTGDTVWVYDNGTLAIRPVEIIWRREDTVLIGSGIADGALVITSNIATPLRGMRLRLGDRTNTANSAQGPRQ